MDYILSKYISSLVFFLYVIPNLSSQNNIHTPDVITMGTTDMNTRVSLSPQTGAGHDSSGARPDSSGACSDISKVCNSEETISSETISSETISAPELSGNPTQTPTTVTVEEIEKGYGLCDFLEKSTYYDGFCFKVFDDLMTWENSRLSCQSDILGGTLAEPQDSSAAQFLYHMLVANALESGNDGEFGAWIGASRKTTEDNYVWASNGLTMWEISPEMTVTDWPRSTSEDNCRVITSKSRIGAKHCLGELKRICQIAVDPICPTGTRYYDGYCYFVLGVTANYTQAKETCENAYNSSLVEIYTSDSSRFLQEFLFEKLWTLVSSHVSEKMQLDNYGIKVASGKDFCFAVRGLGNGKIIFHTDAKTSCLPTLVLNTNRNEKEIISSIKFCDTCETNCKVNSEPIKLQASGVEWTYYCIEQRVVESSVRLVYQNGEFTAMTELRDDAFTQHNMTNVFLESEFLRYQWRFPSTDGSLVYLGATGTTKQWESGVDINFDILGMMEVSELGTGGKDRLMFQNFPVQVQPVSGDEDIPVLCRYRWGAFSYMGFVPLNLYMNSHLFISHDVKTVALLNYDPGIAGGVLTRTDIKPLTTSFVTVFMSDIWDTESEQVRFVVRSHATITVELFSSSDQTYAFSTLLLPDVTTDTKYVICAPHAVASRISVMNHWENNKIYILVPQYRDIYVVYRNIKYRVYHTIDLMMSPLQLISVDFIGDMSGAVIAGKKKLSVFIGTNLNDLFNTVATPGQDIYFKQIFPANKLGSVHPLLSNNLPSLPTAYYKIVAMTNDTEIHLFRGKDIVLNLWGDVWIEPSTKTMYVAQSNVPTHTIFGISDERMSCAMTLLPKKYWKDHYDFWVTPFHDSVILFLITEEEISDMIFNTNVRLNCFQIPQTAYKICNTMLHEGHYNISSGSGVQEPFAAYILGIKEGLSCFMRVVDILHTSEANNNYQLPTYATPETCPNITVTPTLINDLTNTTTTNPPTEPPVKEPAYPYSNTSMTIEEIEEEIREEVKKELAVNERQTSNFVRKKISVPDYRTSSTTIGYVGIAIISMTTCLIVSSDVFSLFRWFMELLRF